MATAENSTISTPVPQPREAPAVPDPSASVRRLQFDVDEYYLMGEVGILKRGQRVELIDGDILVMCPTGSPHHGCVSCLNYLLTTVIGPRGVVSVRGPVRLNRRSEPEPDLAILKPRADYYRTAHAGPADVLLIIEVMVTSADYDRKVKLGLYARSGIPEVWLVDLNAGSVEVYRRPADGNYSERTELARGQSLAPGAFPDVVLGVDAILG